jgi:chorismate lyase/3-hydroxybenzoate synthase
MPGPFFCVPGMGRRYHAGRRMNTVPAPIAGLSRFSPRIRYQRFAPGEALPGDVLFAVGFGASAPQGPRRVRVPLEPLLGAGLTETWSANGDVIAGESGAIRFSHDGHLLAGVIEVPERDHGGIVEATAFAYRSIATFLPASDFSHLLRTWNHLDAINLGDGDTERYRGFCSGRVIGLEGLRQAHHPAATVIGRRDGERVLQVYWLAGREPGVAMENPRQVSAYLYPREYGETAPTFSRAMLVSPELVLVSGTASIVGHESRHSADTNGQVREILANLDSLLHRAHAQAPSLPRQFGRHTMLKAYLKRREDLAQVEDALRAVLPPQAPLLVLQGDVCRSELLVEFDCTHAA